MQAYEYKHTITFKETNVVGNVYFSNHLNWQGSCREMFLKNHAPEVLEEFSNGLSLVTTKVACEYFDELHAFDEIVIKMYGKPVGPGRITMSFDYFRVTEDSETLVARGEQQIATMRQNSAGIEPEPLPQALENALSMFV